MSEGALNLPPMYVDRKKQQDCLTLGRFDCDPCRFLRESKLFLEQRLEFGSKLMGAPLALFV